MARMTSKNDDSLNLFVTAAVWLVVFGGVALTAVFR